MCLCVFSILPLVGMGFIPIPQLELSWWLVMDLENVNWNTRSCEVENRNQSLPKALVLCCDLSRTLSYDSNRGDCGSFALVGSNGYSHIKHGSVYSRDE